MIRIFAASSQMGTMLEALFAARTSGKDSVDILIIDNEKKKKSLLKQVYGTSAVHPWNNIIDLSYHIDDDYDFKVSALLHTKRKVRTYPVFKQFYGIALKLYLMRRNRKLVKRIREGIKQVAPAANLRHDPVELYTLPNLFMNRPIDTLCKNKKVGFFEHGLGDYLDLLKHPVKTDFYGVFAERFEKYLQQRNIKHIVPHHYIDIGTFDKAAKALFNCTPEEEKQIEELGNKKCVLLLLDAAEMYNPPNSFWTDYIQTCIDKVQNPHEYTFLIKPHGLMSEYSQRVSYDYIRRSGLNHIIFDRQSTFFNLGAEIFFARMKHKIAYVFSTVSSSIFYIPHFYPNEAVYVHHHAFCKPYFQNAPPRYKNNFMLIEDLINEVFTDQHAGIYNSTVPNKF